MIDTINRDRIVEDTLELVKICDNAGDTRTIANLYMEMLEKTGFTVEKHEFIPNNPTLIARYKGKNSDNNKLVFNGHMDVIPLEHVPPYIENDRIYGRGTCDMKGSLACILETVRALKKHGSEINGEIIVVANSMHESPGGRGEDLIKMSEDYQFEADAAIVMEGATYDCTIAQLGSATFNITVEREGEPSHQLYTPEGTPHPISVLGRVVQRLDEENLHLKEEKIADVGYGSYFIGNIESGAFYNQMPKQATIEGVRRYGPDDSFKEIKQTTQSILDEIAEEFDVKIDLDMRKVRDGYRINKQDPIVDILQESVKKARNIDLPLVGKKLVTDAGIFAKDMGIPTVCYGPDQRKAHAALEYVEISELEKTVQVYLEIIHKYLVTNHAPE